MLIYTSNSNSPFGASAATGYKSASKRKRGGIPRKVSKRNTQQRRSSSSYKVKKAKKSKRNHRKKKSLSAKNVKFMKSLGFRVKKKH